MQKKHGFDLFLDPCTIEAKTHWFDLFLDASTTKAKTHRFDLFFDASTTDAKNHRFDLFLDPCKYLRSNALWDSGRGVISINVESCLLASLVDNNDMCKH